MSGFFGHGSTVTIDGTPIAGVMDIELPTEAKEEVETTDMDSDFDREYVPGLRDNSTITLTIRMNPGDAGQDALRTNSEADDEVVPFVVALPDRIAPQLQWAFSGFVQELGGTLYWEGTAAERTVTIRVTGAVTESTVV